MIVVFFQGCSFDRKSGIWKNEKNLSDKDEKMFEDFQTLSTSETRFNKIIPIKKNTKFQLTEPIKNYEWNDIYFNQNNNIKNLKYENSKKLLLKSKKISKYLLNEFFLFKDENLITSDNKGNIIIFSINENKVISKFNFYKNKYKKIEKQLNLILENDIIYVSDNIGFLYAYNYKKNSILWAKNFKIPFRSNLKLTEDKLIASRQNNHLIFFNKKNGSILKSFPTENSVIKNQFINNLSMNNENIFFLNTYGSLYAIDTKSMEIKWFLNLNRTTNLNLGNIFDSNQVINDGNNIVLNSNYFTYVIDIYTGKIKHKKNFSSKIQSLIVDGYLFTISKNNFLICTNIDNGKIVYSYNINQKISEYLKIKEEKVEFQNFLIANNKILIFLKSSYLLTFTIYGELEDIIELPSKIKTKAIIVDSSILYLDKKNKLSILN